MPDLIHQRVESCFLLAEQYFRRTFHRPQTSLCLRGQSAGAAHLQSNRLRFNARLYRENCEDFLRQTVAHEVAHLVAYQLHGLKIRPHGKEWQAIMQQVFGLPPVRCHAYRLPPAWRTFYLYHCRCMQHPLSPQRHGRIRRGQLYLCRSCNGRLTFSGESRRVLVER